MCLQEWMPIVWIRLICPIGLSFLCGVYGVHPGRLHWIETFCSSVRSVCVVVLVSPLTCWYFQVMFVSLNLFRNVLAGMPIVGFRSRLLFFANRFRFRWSSRAPKHRVSLTRLFYSLVIQNNAFYPVKPLCPSRENPKFAGLQKVSHYLLPGHSRCTNQPYTNSFVTF